MIQIQGKATVRLPPDAELARHDDGKLKFPVAPDGMPRFILYWYIMDYQGASTRKRNSAHHRYSARYCLTLCQWWQAE